MTVLPPYAQILVELDAKSLDRKTFTYRIPPELADLISIGTAVSVPFGHMHSVTGYIVGFSHTVEAGFRVKAIADVLDEEPLFDLTFLEFLDWVAQIYGTPLMQVLTTALPSSVIQKTRHEVLLKAGGGESFKAHLDDASRRIVDFLETRPQGKGVAVRYLASKAGLTLKKTQQILNRMRQQEQVDVVRVTQTAMAEKKVKWLRIVSPAEVAGLTERQVNLVEQLKRLEEAVVPLTEVLTELKTTRNTLEKLAEQGVLEIFEAPQHRDRNPLLFYANATKKPFKALNAEQENAYRLIMAAPPGSQHMIYGVTGSGKTEVYLALTRAMLEEGKAVMVLVPEISLTSHIAKRFIEQFGIDQIALWHSQLSNGERVDTWRRVYRGELQIIIGARSAIFVPITNLGLIVLDEEHDSSFKQDSPAPRYHAKTLAQELSKRRGAKLVLGSATPDVETYYAAEKEQCIIPMTQRYGGRSMASVTLVDMRPVPGRAPRKTALVSEELQAALTETLAQQKQAIVLLNRRGFYTLITCYHCQQTLQCPHCAVAVTYHRGHDVVRCHYCGYEAAKPDYCPTCASSRLGYGGFGTQRLAEELESLFPEARLTRLDSDVAQRKDATRTILEGFGHGEADILVGTQMVAKGLDIPNVTLVGVVGADTAFMLPDYKASERGFQLLTQVAGRSGRGECPGQVVIQTCQPEHPVILRARDQDYDGFYADELGRRKAFDFPPYSQLFRLIVSSLDEAQGWHFIQTTAHNLKFAIEQAALDIVLLGPASCVISRIQGRYRFHLMVKNRSGTPGHHLMTKYYTQAPAPDGVHFLLDVEAQSFL